MPSPPRNSTSATRNVGNLRPSIRAVVTQRRSFKKGDQKEVESSTSLVSLSEREKKVIRDAFNLFDTDGDGSVTKDELKHVMETLFNTDLNEEELEQMVNDVDKDDDGEVSFEEFAEKVSTVIQVLKDGMPSQGEPGQGQDADRHWQSLSRLISHFSENDEPNSNLSPASADSFGNMLGMQKNSEKKKKLAKRKVAWNQHDAMVAHFNLRRLSMDGTLEEDEMQAAMRVS